MSEVGWFLGSDSYPGSTFNNGSPSSFPFYQLNTPLKAQIIRITPHVLMLAFLLLFLSSDLARGAAIYDSDVFFDSLEASLGLPLSFSTFNLSVLGSNGAPDIGKYSKTVSFPGHLHGHPSKTRKVPRSQPQDVRPTPAPTGNPSPTTTVHIDNEHDFAILLPERPQGIWIFLSSH